MIHNHELIYKKLIEQYYGLVPAVSAQVLLHHGVINIKQALAYSSLNKKDFLKGLDVLNRCNFVKVIEIKRLILLEILTESISNILYYPHYIAIVQRHYNVEASLLLKTIILYGNLSTSELIEWTIYHFIKNNSSDWNDTQIETCIDLLVENFNLLKSSNLIVNLGSSKAPNRVDKDKIRQSLAKKIQFEEENASLYVCESERNCKWALNIDALNSRLFIELFPYFINQPFENKQASDILNCLLELNFEKTYSMRKECSISLKDIYNKYRTEHLNETIHITKLETLLGVYSHFFVPGFMKVEKGNYTLKFDDIFLNIIKVIVKEFVKKNFGENSVKIFGALLEEPRIMETTLLNILKIASKELHRSIYHLDKYRMININLFSEPNQQSAFSAKNIKKVFAVDLNNVVGCILKRCNYSLYTLLNRKHLEMSEHNDLIQRKNHIETYKTEINKQIEDEEEKNVLVQAAHNFMSEKDHQQSDKLISYDKKTNKVEYDLVNYVFLLNMYKQNNSKIVNDNVN